jgi:acyl-CoA reductase-like NAD-dependent aldehyde dehydrogenase
LAELVRAFADAGVPPGVVSLVFGVPAEITGASKDALAMNVEPFGPLALP